MWWRGGDGSGLGMESERSFGMSDRPVFLYAATYASLGDAEADYDTLLDLHDADFVGTYDVAVISKDDEGKVHVKKHEKPTQHGAWTGAGVGAVLGILFPPALVATAAVGAATGGVIGHLARGMSRSDMKEVGDLLDAGRAALIAARSELGLGVVRRGYRKAMPRSSASASVALIRSIGGL
jgi:uncharacterized membrane protein